MRKQWRKSTDEIETILYRVLVQHEQHHVVVKEFRISQARVSQLVNQALHNPLFLRELKACDQKREAARTAIAQFVAGLNERHLVVDSVEQVKGLMHSATEVSHPTWLIRQVMRGEL